MEENERQEELELAKGLLEALDDGWDDDDDFVIENDEGSEDNDEPVVDEEPDQDEDGNPEPDSDSDETEAEPEDSEEPGDEAETGNQRFKIKYNGAEEEYDLDQMTVLAQKGRDYDHVREERDGMKGKYGKYEGFLKKLADKAGVSIEEQIDLTEAMWLMDEEAEKGNSLTEAEALLRVQRNRNTAAEKKEEAQQNETNKEIDRFLAIYPGTKYEDIPQDVWDMYNRTGDLLGSYQAWEIKQLRTENEKIKREAHNERNAQRSTGPQKSTGAKRKRSVIDEAWYSED